MSNTLPEYWEGYLSGTNRGAILVRIQQGAGNLEGKAILYDQTYGVTIISLRGTLTGTSVNLQLNDFRLAGMYLPLDGKLSLNLAPNFQSAEGNWDTDIGTQGTCKLRATKVFSARGWLRLTAARLELSLRRRAASAYVAFLLIVLICDLSTILKVSFPSLVLLLLPIPFLLRTPLVDLIREYRVRKIGPVEFEPQNPLTSDIRQLIVRHIDETLRFRGLDAFFVLRTKQILIWLANNRSVSRAEFNSYSASIGVSPDNIDVTWQAIVTSGCATVSDGDRLTVIDLGDRYVAYLTGQAGRT